MVEQLRRISLYKSDLTKYWNI